MRETNLLEPLHTEYNVKVCVRERERNIDWEWLTEKGVDGKRDFCNFVSRCKCML